MRSFLREKTFDLDLVTQLNFEEGAPALSEGKQIAAQLAVNISGGSTTAVLYLNYDPSLREMLWSERYWQDLVEAPGGGYTVSFNDPMVAIAWLYEFAHMGIAKKDLAEKRAAFLDEIQRGKSPYQLWRERVRELGRHGRNGPRTDGVAKLPCE